MKRGEVWWADLAEPAGSEPGHRRPVLIVQADDFNRSRIRTVVAVAITSNPALASAPGNVPLSGRSAGLDRESVVNVSQVVTLDKRFLIERAGQAINVQAPTDGGGVAAGTGTMIAVASRCGTPDRTLTGEAFEIAGSDA